MNGLQGFEASCDFDVPTRVFVSTHDMTPILRSEWGHFLGSQDCSRRVIRGAGWINFLTDHLRVSNRGWLGPKMSDVMTGFRVLLIPKRLWLWHVNVAFGSGRRRSYIPHVVDHFQCLFPDK